MRREIPEGVFTLTMHPQVIGRGHRMLMLEKLIIRLREMGAEFLTMERALAEWQAHRLTVEQSARASQAAAG